MSTDRSTKVIVGICAVLFIASIAVIVVSHKALHGTVQHGYAYRL